MGIIYFNDCLLVNDKQGGITMIEKITNQNQIARHKLAEKINELVDVVNALVYEHDKDSDWYDGIATKEQPDPYAEQRKWIGKICKFWDNLDTNYSLAILVKIIEKEPMPFEDYRGNQWYHCEPVKPDDDIIYKGE